MAERTARAEGWGWAEAAAAAAGLFLVWRGLVGRGGVFRLLAGAFVLRRVLSARGGRARAAAGARVPGQRDVEVVEVKSPAELEPGVASASPQPTFANRVDRGDDPRR